MISKIATQTIQLDSWNNTTTKYKTQYLIIFLEKMSAFLEKHPYGVCIPSIYNCYQDAYMNCNPSDSADSKIELINEYISNMTSNGKDKFKYFFHQPFLYNKRNQIIWYVTYENEVIINRYKILNKIHNFSKFGLTEEEAYKAFFMLRYKIYDHLQTYEETIKQFNSYKKEFKAKSLAWEVQYNGIDAESMNVYGHILYYINLKTDYF